MSSSTSLKTPWDPSATPYPVVERGSTVEDFTRADGTIAKVADPYSALHDPDSDSTKAFVTQQGDFAKAYLDQYPHRDQFKTALKENWNYPRFSCPSLKGDGKYYFSFNSGLDPQPSLYRFPASGLSDTKDPITSSEPEGDLFFATSQLSTDGSVSRSSSSFSEDGKWFAYALSRSGSDWTTVYIRSTDKPHKAGGVVQNAGEDEGREEKDVLRFVKFSGIGWTADSKGFFYQRFPERKKHGTDTDDKAGTETDSDLDAMLYYHKVGTTQDQDVLVHKDAENREWMFGAGGTEDGRYVVMSASKDTARSNLLWIADLEESEIGADMKWHKVVNEWGSYYSEIGNDGSKFYFYTNADDASNYKIVTYDLASPDKGFTDLIAHDPKALLSSCHIAAHDKLLLLYSIDVTPSLYLHSLTSGARITQVAPNLLGSISQIAGRRKDNEFWFSVTSFLEPGTVWRYECVEGKEDKMTKFRTAKVKGIEEDDFVSRQVFYESKDGTRVPMFVTYPKSVKQDGTAPAILYGYGGFSSAIEPFFSPSLLTWIKHYRGVLAIANIRGGDEYGESWHLAGTKERKQNVFDDFQYAAKHLISEKLVAKDKVAISGGSNGGLLVAACVNQAPELFGAAIADVGVLDMLRFQRFTIGRAWVSDYGNADEKESFDYLYKYSPLHNVDSSKVYPPTMLLTADHDDRVVPLHSFKHAAELQYKLPKNPNPLLLRVDTKSGHGAGKSTDKKIDEAVDKYGFVAQSMGLKWYE